MALAAQRGAALRSAREAAHLSREEVARRLHVSVKFLGAVEDGKIRTSTTFLRTAMVVCAGS
jgi:cytoskeletal protein RodZ